MHYNNQNLNDNLVRRQVTYWLTARHLGLQLIPFQVVLPAAGLRPNWMIIGLPLNTYPLTRFCKGVEDPKMGK